MRYSNQNKKAIVYYKIKKIILIVFLIVLCSTITFFIGKKIGLNTDTSITNTTIEEVLVGRETIEKTLSSSGEIKTSEIEKLSLSTTYYYSKILVEEGDIVKKGEKIVKYTNGKYLKAPYDLVIKSVSLPDKGKKATSKHYIEVQNMKSLVVELSVNESEISNIHVGQEVEITLTADSSKKYTGKITKISAIGNYSSSGSTFQVEVSLENDGDIRIGMSVSLTIDIEKLEDVIAVPIGAVQISGDRRYVFVVDNSEVKEVDVTTGLSDDTYVEIKSGLTEGEIIQVITTTTQNTIRNNSNNKSDRGNGNNHNMPGGNFEGGDNFNGDRFEKRRENS